MFRDTWEKGHVQLLPLTHTTPALHKCFPGAVLTGHTPASSPCACADRWRDPWSHSAEPLGVEVPCVWLRSRASQPPHFHPQPGLDSSHVVVVGVGVGEAPWSRGPTQVQPTPRPQLPASTSSGAKGARRPSCSLVTSGTLYAQPGTTALSQARPSLQFVRRCANWQLIDY